MTEDIEALAQKLAALPKAERDKLYGDIAGASVWVPNPGKQTDAYFSLADELYYGGQAAGGKTDLGLGLALTCHSRSLLLRRYLSDAEYLAERTMEITGTREGYNGQAHRYRYENRVLDFGGVKDETDKQRYKGTPRDLYFFDEIPDFLKSQYEFIIGWNRSADPKQRCRVVAAGNPPTEPEGMWVIERWGAWLDPNHPKYPTPSGVLRWYLTGDDGVEYEVDGPGPHLLKGMEKPLVARSRTFIRAQLKDNPDMAATDYDAVLSRLPPHLRAAYRDGRFDLALKERARQVIPTDWVRAAMERWQPRPPDGLPMSAMGVDCAGGGEDSTVIAPRYDGWFAPMVSVKGAETKEGPAMAGLVMSKRRDNALVIIDMGGGYGGSVYDHLKENGITCYAYKGSHKSHGKTADGQMRFANTRSEAYWKFREALDPGQPFGSRIELPKDNELLADLCAPEFTVKSNGYQITPKETLVEKLGRSPDKGDAVVMSWFKGDKLENHTWQKGEQGGILRRPKGMVVNMGPRRSK